MFLKYPTTVLIAGIICPLSRKSVLKHGVCNDVSCHNIWMSPAIWKIRRRGVLAKEKTTHQSWNNEDITIGHLWSCVVVPMKHDQYITVFTDAYDLSVLLPDDLSSVQIQKCLNWSSPLQHTVTRVKAKQTKNMD